MEEKDGNPKNILSVFRVGALVYRRRGIAPIETQALRSALSRIVVVRSESGKYTSATCDLLCNKRRQAVSGKLLQSAVL